jgi:hypothetical protein
MNAIKKHSKSKLGAVAHFYNPNYVRSRDEMIVIGGQPWENS